MSFVCPRELVSFDPQHVPRFLQSENAFEFGGVTIIVITRECEWEGNFQRAAQALP